MNSHSPHHLIHPGGKENKIFDLSPRPDDYTAFAKRKLWNVGPKGHDQTVSPYPVKKSRVSLPGKSILKALVEDTHGPNNVDLDKDTLFLNFDGKNSDFADKDQQVNKLQPQKTLARRVSFAATAHVRVYDKDFELEAGSSPIPCQKSPFDEGELPSSPAFSDTLNAGNMFQIPDLSSVQQRSSDVFNLRLCLDGSNRTGELTNHSEADSEKTERSFEISLKHDTENESCSGNRDELPNHHNQAIKSPTKFIQNRRTSIISMRRDSIDSNCSEGSEMEMTVAVGGIKESKDFNRAIIEDISFAISEASESDMSMCTKDLTAHFGTDLERPKSLEMTPGQDIENKSHHEQPNQHKQIIKSPIRFASQKNRRASILSGRRDSVDSVCDDCNEMEMTVAVGGIKEINGVDCITPGEASIIISEPSESNTSMDITEPIGGIVQKTIAQSPIPNNIDEDNYTVAMDMTAMVGGIQAIYPRLEGDNEGASIIKSNDGMTMDLTKALNECLANENNSDDILDEHPPILENSFASEESLEHIPVHNYTLKEFLEFAGVNFMDNMTSTNRRETITFDRDPETPTIVDYVIAAAATMPELELYHFCCSELVKYIEEGKQAVASIEAVINQNNPRFFHEYFDGSIELRDFMEQRFKLIKTHSRLSAKENWYDWRDKLTRNVNLLMQNNLEMLKTDKKHVDNINERLDDIMPNIEEHHRSLKIKYQAAKAREEAYARCDKEQLAVLEEAIEEQSVQINLFNADLKGLEAHESELKEKIKSLETQKEELNKAIQKAQVLREESKCLTAEDLAKLKENYHYLESIHRWTPMKMQAKKIELEYDQAVQVVVDLERLRHHEAEAVQVSLLDAPKGRIFGVFLNEIIKSLDIWQVQDVLYRISSFWHKLNLLEADISWLELKFQTEIIRSEDSVIQTQTTLFSSKSQMKFRLNLLFRPSDVLAYPNLEAVQSKCEVMRGAIKQPQMEELVRRHLIKGGYGCLRNMYTDIERLLT